MTSCFVYRLRRKIEAAVEGEWPPRTPLMYVTGKTECVRCGGQFGTLWIGNGRCCFRCEEGMRSRLHHIAGVRNTTKAVVSVIQRLPANNQGEIRELLTKLHAGR